MTHFILLPFTRLQGLVKTRIWNSNRTMTSVRQLKPNFKTSITDLAQNIWISQRSQMLNGVGLHDQ
jgi:hypothetical protein